VEIKTGLGDVLRQGLREGRLDLAITPLTDSDPAEFETLSIADDTMRVATRIGHPLDHPDVAAGDLAPYTWLLPSPVLASTGWLMTRLQSLGLPKPHIQVEADTVIMLRRVVSRTDLLTFLSVRDLDHGEGTALRGLMLPEVTLQRRFGALWQRGRHLSPAIERVIDLLRATAESSP
jgi:DNA-binding transcriptional LysR family regulator